ncbi:MAG: MATE family efflux transporter [Clostridiales bacterium]|nr:MATE family efflux transporter [Clostridiales bacterium]
MMSDKEDKRIYTLSQEEPYIAVIRMGLPLIAGMFIMVLYNWVDTYFIGLTKDDYQLAAVNLSYPVMMVMIALANMIGTGASSFIARCLGANNLAKAKHTLTTGFVLTVINGILVSLIGLALLDKIVSGLGAEEFTYEYTKQYVSIILIGSVFTMGSYTFSAFLRSEGSVKISMIGMVVGTIVNIILDPIFIFTLNMQIRGAAIATVLGNVAGALVSVIFYLLGKSLLKPSAEMLRPTAEIIKEIYWVGVPASLETLLTAAAYTVNNNLAVTYGPLTVAATGIAQKLISLGSYVYQGFASGVQPIMGYNYGAKNYTRMKAVLKAGVITVTTMELILMAAYGILAPTLVDIFTDSPEVIRIGAQAVRAMMLILPFVGSVSMCRMSFQAMGKPVYAFCITLVRQLILYIPLLIIFNKLFGFKGLIHAQPVTEAVMMAVSIMFLLRFIDRINDENSYGGSNHE